MPDTVNGIRAGSRDPDPVVLATSPKSSQAAFRSIVGLVLDDIPSRHPGRKASILSLTSRSMPNTLAASSGWISPTPMAERARSSPLAAMAGSASFGAGRGSFFPQNNARLRRWRMTSISANALMERAGVPTLGGKYFFQHERYRAHRPPGHEHADAVWHFAELGDRAFIKPLMGSRGDFAEIVAGGDALQWFISGRSRSIADAILMQRICPARNIACSSSTTRSCIARRRRRPL